MNPGNLPPEIAAELEKLRDIRLPEPVGWWPLAPGWWALLALVCAAILAVWGWRAWRRRTLRYRALRELEALAAAADRTDPAELAARVEILLKRLVRLRDPRLATSHGAEWIDALTHGKGAMPDDIARLIAEAPYAAGRPRGDKPFEIDRDRLLGAARRWIRSYA